MMPTRFKFSLPSLTIIMVILLTCTAMFSLLTMNASADVRISEDNIGFFDSKNPSVAMSSDGVIYSVWEDNRPYNDIPNIFFTKSTNNGQDWADDSRVNKDPGLNYQCNDPAVACYGTDNVYVVWSDHQNENDFDIYLTISNNKGNTWSQDKQITTNSANQVHPWVVVKDENTVYICWEDERNGNSSTHYQTDIYFRTYDPIADSLGPEIKVNDDEGLEAQKRPMMVLGSQGTIHIAWEDGRNGNSFLNNNWDIYVGSSHDGGNTWINTNVIDDTLGYNQLDPYICIDKWDSLYVSWTDHRTGLREIHFAPSFDAGSTFETNMIVNINTTSETDERDSSIAVDANGIIYVSYVDSRDIGEDWNLIYITRSYNGGVNFLEPQWFDSSVSMGKRPNSPQYDYADMEKEDTNLIISGSKIVGVWEDYRNDPWPDDDLPEDPDIYSGMTAPSPNKGPNLPVIDIGDISFDHIEVTWNVILNPDFYKYELYSSTQAGVSMSPENKVGEITDRMQTSYKSTGLEQNTTYYFKLRVYDEKGLYADSNEVSATTLKNVAPTLTFKKPDAFTEKVDKTLYILWEDFDPEENATLTFYLDRDGQKGDSTWIFNSSEDPDGIYDEKYLDTEDLTDGNYYIMCELDDGVNPTVTVFSVKFVIEHYVPEKIPPEVVSTYPKDEEMNITVDTPIKVQFSKDMDNTTFTSNNITVEVEGKMYDSTFSYDASTYTVTLNPVEDLPYDSIVNVTVKIQVKGIHKNFLKEKHTFSFVTEPNIYPPKPVEYFPAENALNIAYSTDVWVRYNSDIQWPFPDMSNFLLKPKNSIEEVTGTVSLVSGDTIHFDPDGKLLPNTEYYVRVGGYKGTNGENADMAQWYFTTEPLPPTGDYDNDRMNNENDPFPTDPTEQYDTDGDGEGDNSDTDIDGDGYNNTVELLVETDPKDKNDVPEDLDQDMIPDQLDLDADGDGVLKDDDEDDLDPDVGLKEGMGNTFWYVLIILAIVLIFIVIVIMVMKMRKKDDGEEDWDEDEYDDEDDFDEEGGRRRSKKKWSKREYVDEFDDEEGHRRSKKKRSKRDHDDEFDDEDDFDEEDDFDDFDEEDDFDDFDDEPDDFDDEPDDFDDDPDDFDDEPDDFDEDPDDFDDDPDDFDEDPDDLDDDPDDLDNELDDDLEEPVKKKRSVKKKSVSKKKSRGSSSSRRRPGKKKKY